MFSASTKTETRTRPATTTSLGRRHTLQLDLLSCSQDQMKSLKQQLKEVEEEYQAKLQRVNNIRNSISKTQKRTCMTRLSFMKAYESKKGKLEDYHLREELKLCRSEHNKSRTRKAKEQKLNEEVKSFCVRTQLDKSCDEKRRRNRTQKNLLRKKIEERRRQAEMDAKSQFERVKDSEIHLKARRHKIAQYQALRARDNYLMKMGEEIQLINSFNNILEEVDRWEAMAQEEASGREGTFFVTKQ